jgi:hypothetical protein
MEIGKMKVTEAVKHLDPIAKSYGLKLNRVKDFKLARLILVNLYCRELV